MSARRTGIVQDAPAREGAVERGRILVIDDEPIIQEVLDDILSREGHAVEVAADAEAGLAALERAGYDLVIGDDLPSRLELDAGIVDDLARGDVEDIGDLYRSIFGV